MDLPLYWCCALTYVPPFCFRLPARCKTPARRNLRRRTESRLATAERRCPVVFILLFNDRGFSRPSVVARRDAAILVAVFASGGQIPTSGELLESTWNRCRLYGFILVVGSLAMQKPKDHRSGKAPRHVATSRATSRTNCVRRSRDQSPRSGNRPTPAGVDSGIRPGDREPFSDRADSSPPTRTLADEPARDRNRDGLLEQHHRPIARQYVGTARRRSRVSVLLGAELRHRSVASIPVRRRIRTRSHQRRPRPRLHDSRTERAGHTRSLQPAQERHLLRAQGRRRRPHGHARHRARQSLTRSSSKTPGPEFRRRT